MKKQTAVEWVIQKLIGSGYLTQGPSNTVNGLKVKRIINQAKEMEKQQSISDYCAGFEASGEGWNGEYGLKDMLNIAEEIKAEKYYNETYGGDK